MHKSTHLDIETATWITIVSIPILTSAKKDQTWEMQDEYLLMSIVAEEIVVKNLQLLFDATADELWLYLTIGKNAFEILMLTLIPEIVNACSRPLFPHKVWTHFHSLIYL
jgi:hypothetical protein